MTDPTLRATLGAAGARRARERYSWQRVAAAIVETYAEVAEARQPAARESRRL